MQFTMKKAGMEYPHLIIISGWKQKRVPDNSLLSQHSLDVLAKRRRGVLVPIMPSVPDGRSAESRKANPKLPPTQEELMDALGIPKKVAAPTQAEIMDAAGIPKGPVAVPTGTSKPLPKAGPLEPSMFLPAKPGEREGTQLYQRREAPKPTLGQRLTDVPLPGAGITLKKLGEGVLPVAATVLTPLAKATEWYDKMAEENELPSSDALFLANPGLRVVGGLEQAAIQAKLVQAGRAAASGAKAGVQKAAPVVRRLATEEAGAVGKSRTIPYATIDEYEEALARGDSEALAVQARLEGKPAPKKPAARKKPITKPAAAEALGPAAKPALATTKVSRNLIEGRKPTAVQIAKQAREDAAAQAEQEAFRQAAGAPRTPVGAGQPTGVLPKVGDEVKIMGVDSNLVDTQTIGGVRYEIYSAARSREKQAAIRVIDADSGQTITNKAFPTFEAASAEYATAIRAAGGTVPPRAAPQVVSRPATPVGARRTPQQVPESVQQMAAESRAAPTGAKAAAEQAPSPAPAAPPTRKAPTIRRITQPEPGFSVIGVDAQGRKVRAVAPTLKEAQAIRANILAGKEPFAGAEIQFQQKAVASAERRMKAAIKRGDKGAEQRADVELHELYSTGGKLPPKPPKPPTIAPGGASVPPPSFEGARDKLVKILQTSVRRSNKELEALRAAERKRRAGLVEAGFQRAKAAGEPPIARIRAAQRGEFPTPELELADRLLPEEVSALRGSIYDTLGPELRQTAANVDEALTRLATEGKLPTPSELAWMEEIYGPELVKALLQHRTRGAKALEIGLGIWNLPRALLASFDDSMVLRQGLNLLPEGAPAGRALKAHVKAITSAGAEEVIAGIRANPWFNHGRARGLDLSLPGVARGLVGREEVFMGAGIGARIPILGRGIRLSERVAEAYLNKLRMETYAVHAQELTRMGASDAAFRELAQNIGILSGRASLGKAQAIAPVLNGLFFSARLNWARAQAPVRILRQVPNLGTPEGRHLAKMLAKDVYGVWAGIAGMLGIAAAAGAAVELDPRSSDFGKMQIGTVRVDPWAGQQQFAVLMARIISGEVKTATTRTVRPQEEMDTLARFIESKFHPALGQLIAVKRGKTYVGEELTVNEYAKQWLPLFSQDIQEIIEGTTPGMAVALGTVAFFGVSVYNIPGVPSSVVNQLEDAVNQYTAIPADSLELTSGQPTRQQFREGNPKVDAALFIAGQVTSLASPKAIEEAAKLIKEHGINADDIRGIDQRKERLGKARLAGKKLEETEVDTLIRMLEQGTADAPAPRSQPTPSGPKQPSTRYLKPTPTPEPVGAR